MSEAIALSRIPQKCMKCRKGDVIRTGMKPKDDGQIYLQAQCANGDCQHDWYELYKIDRILPNPS